MKRIAHAPKPDSSSREALRRRVNLFYRRFNSENWDRCFELVDPLLIQRGRVKPDAYSASLRSFKGVYGSVNLWHTRISLHPDGAPKQGDRRPFAFVYVVWQDDTNAFHMFRERWVQENGQWFTRVVGLVPNGPTKSPDFE